MMYRLKQPTIEDAAELAALKAATFSEAFAAANDPTDLAAHLARAFAVETISAELLDPHCDTTWVLDDERPVAYLKVNFGTAQTEPGLSNGLEVEQIYVLASHHGQGLGGRLLDLAAEKAKERGLAFVWLGVWEHNANAISMYRHRGYQEFADHTFMFGQDAQRDVLMRLDCPQGSSVHVHVGAERDRFVGWTCSDPDGHSHDVANCSIADIEVTLKRPKQSELTLRASGTAAYELGMREQNHGISIQPFPDGPAPVPKP